jgi:hypothetical protein
LMLEFRAPKNPMSDHLGLSENRIPPNLGVYHHFPHSYWHVRDIKPGFMTIQHLSCSWVAKANLQGQQNQRSIWSMAISLCSNGPMAQMLYNLKVPRDGDASIHKLEGLLHGLAGNLHRVGCLTLDGIKMDEVQTSRHHRVRVSPRVWTAKFR